MVMNRVAVSLVIGLMMAAATGRAEEALFHSRDVGSYLPEETLIDADGDGKRADLVLLDGISDQLGGTTTQSVLEWSSELSQSTCPTGNPGLQGHLVRGSAITHAANGDLLLIWFDKGISCIDSVTNVVNINLEGSIIGGTGRFFEAMGTVKVTGIAIPEVVVDESGVILFGNMDAETTGRIQDAQAHSR